MHYKLVLVNHVDGVDVQSWDLSPPAVVGREPGSAVCVEHTSISRKHCQFSLNGEGALVVKDLDSMNGTYVDDRRVTTAVLMPGQIVQIGALRLEIEFLGDTPARSTGSAAAKGNVYSTQPMKTFQPVPLPVEKSWWAKLMGR